MPTTSETLDLDLVRASFPALKTPWALLDNAGGSAPCRDVNDLVREHLERLPFQLGASYPLSVEAGEAVAAGRRAAARLLRADEDEVVLGASSTALVRTLATALRPLWREGDEVIVTNLDHETNRGPWLALERTGITVREWRFREDGTCLEVADLDPLLNERTRLVAFTHCSNVVGTVHDVANITARIRAAGALSCVDGVAFAPHRRVDVEALGADLYFVSLYKIYGPHLAALFCRRDLLERLPSQNHHFASGVGPAKLEPGNVSYELAASLPGIVNYLERLAAHHGAADGAADQEPSATDPIDRAFALIARHEERLQQPLLAFLADQPDVRLLGHPSAGPERVPTVTFSVEGRDSREITELLDARQVATRYGHFYSYKAIEDLGWLDRNGVVRASMVHYTTPDEVERLIEGLAAILAR